MRIELSGLCVRLGDSFSCPRHEHSCHSLASSLTRSVFLSLSLSLFLFFTLFVIQRMSHKIHSRFIWTSYCLGISSVFLVFGFTASMCAFIFTLCAGFAHASILFAANHLNGFHRTICSIFMFMWRSNFIFCHTLFVSSSLFILFVVYFDGESHW